MEHDINPETGGPIEPETNPAEARIVHHLAFLPYREAHSVFMTHLHGCPQCTVARVMQKPCSALCEPGHVLCHEVDQAIEDQHYLASLN